MKSATIRQKEIKRLKESNMAKFCGIVGLALICGSFFAGVGFANQQKSSDPNQPAGAEPISPDKLKENLWRYPQESWFMYARPEEAGWSSKKLEEARNYFEKLDSTAIMVIYNGAVVIAWGDIERRYMCHSIRKSYLSALYGIHVDQGNIDLNKTLAELNIDDNPPLTDAEKQAKVVNLLKSRSGVYHNASCESDDMVKYRPKRGSHAPGEFFWYNNWGFNALATIFEQETGTKIFEEFKKNISDPLEMQDFQLLHTFYDFEPDRSIHPGYCFRMSARDMARFGLLFLRKGKWNNQQIISEKWVSESTSSPSIFRGSHISDGYGYMWWVCNSGSFKGGSMYSARGTCGHSIRVLPTENIVYVHRVNTYGWEKVSRHVNPVDQVKLLNMILDAKTSGSKSNPVMIPLPQVPKRTDIINLNPSVLDKYVKEYEGENLKIRVKKIEGNLLIDYKKGKFRLLPLSKSRFIMEDVETPIFFELDNKGNPLSVTLEFKSGQKFYGKSVCY